MTGFVAELKRERAAGKTFRQIASEIGVPHPTLVLVVKGRAGLGIRSMDRIEAAWPQFSRDYLFPKIEEAPRA